MSGKNRNPMQAQLQGLELSRFTYRYGFDITTSDVCRKPFKVNFRSCLLKDLSVGCKHISCLSRFCPNWSLIGITDTLHYWSDIHSLMQLGCSKSTSIFEALNPMVTIPVVRKWGPSVHQSPDTKWFARITGGSHIEGLQLGDSL